MRSSSTRYADQIKYLDEHSEQLTPKTAMELLKIVAPLMRISAGLPASSPLEELRTGNTSGVSVNIATGDTTKTGVHGMSASEVVEKTKQQAEDPTHLASILNVLIQSGALESTILKDNTVDVDFVDVDSGKSNSDINN